MINSKKELNEWITFEKTKYGCESSVKYHLRRLYGSEQAVLWGFQKRLRITEYHYNMNHIIRYNINNIVLNHMRNKYGLQIGLNVCDKGLKIMHLGSVLTNGKTKIGQNVSLHINTAFVAKGVEDGAPIVGNGCVIGVGAVVIGNISIADNVAVGANSVVCKDITEENIAIAGIPAKKVSSNGRLKWNRNGK